MPGGPPNRPTIVPLYVNCSFRCVRRVGPETFLLTHLLSTTSTLVGRASKTPYRRTIVPNSPFLLLVWLCPRTADKPTSYFQIVCLSVGPPSPRNLTKLRKLVLFCFVRRAGPDTALRTHNLSTTSPTVVRAAKPPVKQTKERDCAFLSLGRGPRPSHERITPLLIVRFSDGLPNARDNQSSFPSFVRCSSSGGVLDLRTNMQHLH